MWEEVSDLQKKVALSQSKISCLREQVDRGCSEKLALEHEVCVLRCNLKNRDKNVKELRTEVSRQSDRYNDLWLVHGTSLEEVQNLSSEVIALRSDVREESAGRRPRARTPRVLAPGPGGQVVRPVVLRALVAGMRDLGGGQWIGTVS